MPIQYSCINDGTSLVAEFPPTQEQPQASELAQKIIAASPPKEYRRKALEDGTAGINTFYISTTEGRFVLCVCTADVKMRTAFAFLDAVESLVRGPVTELRNGKKLLKMKLEFYNNPANDKITAFNDEFAKVMDVMVENIDKARSNAEKLDSAKTKSELLKQQAESFKDKAVELKTNLCMKNLKTIVIIVAGLALAALFIAIVSCRPDFSACKSS